MIKGYKQTIGLDYFNTYSQVTRINSFRMVLAIAILRNLEIYMEQPQCCFTQNQEKKVYKLVKSLYELKQAPKQWHQKFDYIIMSHGFKTNECNKCVYVRDKEHRYGIVCLCVDDMLIVGSDDKMITSTKMQGLTWKT